MPPSKFLERSAACRIQFSGPVEVALHRFEMSEGASGLSLCLPIPLRLLEDVLADPDPFLDRRGSVKGTEGEPRENPPRRDFFPGKPGVLGQSPDRCFGQPEPSRPIVNVREHP